MPELFQEIISQAPHLAAVIGLVVYFVRQGREQNEAFRKTIEDLFGEQRRFSEQVIRDNTIALTTNTSTMRELSEAIHQSLKK